MTGRDLRIWKTCPGVITRLQGYFVTANQNLNEFGKATPINVAMGAYRSDRIGDLLANKTTA